MLYGARRRARLSRVPFNIDKNDIVVPGHCPVLGIKLKHGIGRGGVTDASPSLDRLVPRLGYTKGNVVVISNRANRIKSDATPQELEAVASWFRLMLKPVH